MIIFEFFKKCSKHVLSTKGQEVNYEDFGKMYEILPKSLKLLYSIMNSKHNKVIYKVRKRQHQNPLFGHIGDEIFKTRKKRYIGIQ
jgi:hypothetical protein